MWDLIRYVDLVLIKPNYEYLDLHKGEYRVIADFTGEHMLVSLYSASSLSTFKI